MRTSELILDIYRKIISLNVPGEGIPVNLRQKTIIGTVQDDPFDCWVGDLLNEVLDGYEVFHSGKLTTPDIVIRSKVTGQCVGFEVKKLIQQKNGSDSRGLTMDYNSCLPCGKTFIKVGDNTVEIPCYYLFALLNQQSTAIKTLIVMDGDFLNYDVDLHKESKISNYTEYNHGPYGEGSVRHRRMYTYPNPLDSKISLFFERFLYVCKLSDIQGVDGLNGRYDLVVRKDRFGNSFKYSVIDLVNKETEISHVELSGIFDGCKQRKPKPRTAAMPIIPPFLGHF